MHKLDYNNHYSSHFEPRNFKSIVRQKPYNNINNVY